MKETPVANATFSNKHSVQNKFQLIALRTKLTRFQLKENKQQTANIYYHFRVRVHQIAPTS